MRSIPYYMKNKEWYFFDPRYFRHRLTDKAPDKALDSYLDSYSNGYCAVLYDMLVERTKADIEDYIKNKNRYTLTKDHFGTYTLTAIDGKEVDLFENQKNKSPFE